MKNKRAINVKTRVDYIRLLLELHDNGYKWISGGELLSGLVEMVNLTGEECVVIYINRKERIVTWGSVDRHGSLFEDRWIELETYHKNTFSLEESVDGFKVGDKVYVDYSEYFDLNRTYTVSGINKHKLVEFIETDNVAEVRRLKHAAQRPTFKAGDAVNVDDPACPLEIYTFCKIDRHDRVMLSETLYKPHISKLSHAKPQLKPLTRAMVVERAKEYVEKNANKYIKVSFVVNEEKRTVVALEIGLKLGDGKLSEYVCGRGISKCQPDDVFNVHIGKAIALARMLREDVPDHFLKSPLPEALLDGMKVRSHWSGCIFTVGEAGFFWKLDECDIIDDSDVLYYAGSAKSRFYC